MRRVIRWTTGGLIILIGWALFGPSLARRPDDVGSPGLVLLDPGTPVLGTLAAPWSARVIRSVPRVASGKVATLPESAKISATKFRTTILASVVREAGGYELRAVGVGNAVPFDGQELVVTPEGPADVRESLSTVEKVVIGRGYDELSRGRLVATTPTFALLRTPAKLLVGERHEEVNLHYAILVSPSSGSLRTLGWATMPGLSQPIHSINLLPEDLTFDCGLDVAVTRTIGPWSVAWSFAMATLPPGEPVEVDADTLRVVRSNLEGECDSVALEKALRGVLPPELSR